MRKALFNQYIQQHSPGAFAMAMYMLRNRDDASDVMQDACYSLLKQARLPSDSHEFRLLLFRVVRNKAIDRLRSLKVRASESLSDIELSGKIIPELTSDFADPQQTMIQQQQYVLLHTALGSISAVHRDILLLKDWQGFSYAEIAKILDIEAGTVMSRLHRARLALRETMLALDEDQ